MGLFSGGNSSSSTESTTTNSGFSDVNDNASVTSVQGISVGKNGVSNISLTDNGATKSAFAFAEKQSSQAYDFSRDVSKTTATQIGQAIQAVSESARSESENILISLQKYAVYAFLVWGVVQVFKGAR